MEMLFHPLKDRLWRLPANLDQGDYLLHPALGQVHKPLYLNG